MKPKFTFRTLPNCSLCAKNDIVEVLHQHFLKELSLRDCSGERLPAVYLLARKLNVAPQTIRKVYTLLEKSGRIHHLPGTRIWHVPASMENKDCLGLILPVAFSHYFHPHTAIGKHHLQIYAGLEDRATELGYSTLPLLLPAQDASPEEISSAVLNIKNRCCGVIHFGDRGFNNDLPLEKLLEQTDLPQISFNCEFHQQNIAAVTFDEEQVVRTFVSYIREYRHSRCAFIALDHNSSPYTRAMLYSPDQIRTLFLRAGLKEENFQILNFMGDICNPCKTVLHDLLYSPDAPTVFFCRNDEMATELISRIRQEGFRVPEDFSVVGFNNYDEKAVSDLSLSTFYNPMYELGAALINRLDYHIREGITPENRIFRMEAPLVRRQSVGVSSSILF